MGLVLFTPNQLLQSLATSSSSGPPPPHLVLGQAHQILQGVPFRFSLPAPALFQATSLVVSLQLVSPPSNSLALLKPKLSFKYANPSTPHPYQEPFKVSHCSQDLGQTVMLPVWVQLALRSSPCTLLVWSPVQVIGTMCHSSPGIPLLFRIGTHILFRSQLNQKTSLTLKSKSCSYKIPEEIIPEESTFCRKCLPVCLSSRIIAPQPRIVSILFLILSLETSTVPGTSQVSKKHLLNEHIHEHSCPLCSIFPII